MEGPRKGFPALNLGTHLPHLLAHMGVRSNGSGPHLPQQNAPQQPTNTIHIADLEDRVDKALLHELCLQVHSLFLLTDALASSPTVVLTFPRSLFVTNLLYNRPLFLLYAVHLLGVKASTAEINLCTHLSF